MTAKLPLSEYFLNLHFVIMSAGESLTRPSLSQLHTAATLSPYDLCWSLPFSRHFLSVKEVIIGRENLSVVTLFEIELIQNKPCCQAMIIVITCGRCSLAHDSPDSRASVHWLWHSPGPTHPGPAWPPSCPCHTSNLTHRSVFYPDDIIDNLHVMCHNTMETGECNNPSVAPPGPHQLARAQ